MMHHHRAGQPGASADRSGDFQPSCAENISYPLFRVYRLEFLNSFCVFHFNEI